MSYSSLISIRSLQCPCNTDMEFLSLSDNIYYNMNSTFYHSHNDPNVLGLDQSAYGTRFSGSSPESTTTNPTTAHTWELQYIPNTNIGDPHMRPPSHHLLLEGASGESMTLAPSNGPNEEPEDSSLTSPTPKSPELAAISAPGAPTFLDIKAILLPRISPHVREAAGPDGRRKWYCMFPRCAHAPFLRRDRAEVHVASIHLNEKRIYCNGSCGNTGW